MSKKLITTFKIFKHNFWTNVWSRFLYEDVYYKFKTQHISKVAIGAISVKGVRRTIPYVVFTIPLVWLREYRQGVRLGLREFPKDIQEKLKKHISIRVKSLPRVLEKELKNYFVKKITITKKQAKVLMKLQSIDNITEKKLHAIHKKIGLV